jgi:aryl-alcohol dehydrogenase-like predicted oxidoreductase
VRAAWEAGVRYFDTAPHYGLGLSERRLGETLPEGAIVSTKVGRLLIPRANPDDEQDDEGFAVAAELKRVRDYTRDGVLRSLHASLERLKLERIDIVFVHDPDDHERAALEGAFPALEELRSQGVIASYGAGMNQSAMSSTPASSPAIGRAPRPRTTTSRRRRRSSSARRRSRPSASATGSPCRPRPCSSRSRTRRSRPYAWARARRSRSSATPPCSTSRYRRPYGTSSRPRG